MSAQPSKSLNKVACIRRFKDQKINFEVNPNVNS